MPKASSKGKGRAKKPVSSKPKKSGKSPSKGGKSKMASFKYVGDPNDRFSGPDVVEQYGQSFKKGEVVQMKEGTDEEKRNVQKLRGNSHFVDMSDKETSSEVQARQKAIEQQQKEQEKADKAAQEDEEAYREEIEKNREKEIKKRGGVENLAVSTPRPPGTVTREPVQDAFGGRTVEERTQAEDHTKAGKTKGGGTVEL
jgi:uncharacterized protein YifE (UPF0438 family)